MMTMISSKASSAENNGTWWWFSLCFTSFQMDTGLHLVLRSKNEWSYNSTPQYAFTTWCSVKKSTVTTLHLPLPVNYHRRRQSRDSFLLLFSRLALSAKHCADVTPLRIQISPKAVVLGGSRFESLSGISCRD